MSKIKLKDMRGVLIQEDDIVVYGKSNRNHPINIGTVERITDDKIEVLGKGNTKVGYIPHFHANRLIVLPVHYLDF